MADLPPEEREALKRAIYDKISPRRRKFIDRMGYNEWDPFQEPFDPIDIRKDKTGYTAQDLVDEFVRTQEHKPPPEIVQAVQEFTITLVANPERVRGVFDFCVWYNRHLDRHGRKL
ncbi:MAG: hypothetical protein ACOCVM_02735 [Desulfovibrionaceae bacterium]